MVAFPSQMVNNEGFWWCLCCLLAITRFWTNNRVSGDLKHHDARVALMWFDALRHRHNMPFLISVVRKYSDRKTNAFRTLEYQENKTLVRLFCYLRKYGIQRNVGNRQKRGSLPWYSLWQYACWQVKATTSVWFSFQQMVRGHSGSRSFLIWNHLSCKWEGLHVTLCTTHCRWWPLLRILGRSHRALHPPK